MIRVMTYVVVVFVVMFMLMVVVSSIAGITKGAINRDKQLVKRCDKTNYYLDHDGKLLRVLHCPNGVGGLR